MDWVVGPRPGAGPLALQVVEVDPSPCVRVGRHGDHPGRAGLLHAVQEQVGEQERREMVDRKGASQPVGGAHRLESPPGLVHVSCPAKF